MTAVTALSAAVFGCATTSQEWLSEPVTPIDPCVVNRSTEADLRIQPAVARPRLDHTVTLGEIDSASVANNGAARAEVAAAPVIVNIHNYNQAQAAASVCLNCGIDSRATFLPHQRSTGSQPAPARGIQPGSDWPAPPSYGPAFPMRSGLFESTPRRR